MLVKSSTAMAIQVRRLTAREHSLSAFLLSVVITMACADMASPLDAKLEMAGHTAVATCVTASPAIVLLSALLVLLPRTGNESRFAFFRFVGRFPLLIRYFVIFLIFIGRLMSTANFFGLGQR